MFNLEEFLDNLKDMSDDELTQIAFKVYVEQLERKLNFEENEDE